VAILEYCTLLLAVTVIGSDTYVIYDPIFTVHNIHTSSVKSFIYMKLLGIPSTQDNHKSLYVVLGLQNVLDCGKNFGDCDHT
jgi:hypothetical protein